ncbi:hypothetical protein DKX38_030015 [Salix brachista]|uniref:Uncharacterized protein n=1 Tax=Salix brachista TaxID=2182728 RepID=A0A5N5JCR1_9ROSI|nr:hypothetical protein DKX38_029870 [Salix brachista]KAB5512987.1 hypothetical protein DKX38_030015 [Salix brachista]
MVKATLVDKNGFRKGAWSKEEDDKLRVYVQKYGHWNWRQLPKFAGLSRCGKSCRLRWMNYLRPDVKRGNFSHEEDNLILQMLEELGNKWSIIAGKLPGRTDNEIKNHWHTNLSKKVKRNQSVSSGLVEKEQYRETSQSEDSQTEKSETESVSVNSPPKPHHQPDILEIFHSPQEISCSEFSSMNNDSVSSSVKGAADGFSPAEIFQDSVSDFWNLPFLADNNDNQDGYHSLLFTEEVYMHSYAFNYDDDSIDWIQQMMQELQYSN